MQPQWVRRARWRGRPRLGGQEELVGCADGLEDGVSLPLSVPPSKPPGALQNSP